MTYLIPRHEVLASVGLLNSSLQASRAARQLLVLPGPSVPANPQRKMENARQQRDT